MARWFRFYDDALNDPKVQCLAPDLFKVWVNLLCVASKNDGALPAAAELGFLLRIDVGETEAKLTTLAKAGLLDKVKGCYMPHNWHGRQFKSDASNERVKRHRQRHSNGDGNADSNGARNGDVTPSESDTETEADTEQNQTHGDRAKKNADPPLDLELPEALDRQPDEAVRLWNELAERCELATVQRLTEPRRRSLKARLTECGGIEGWKAALARIDGNDFLLGSGDRGWKADFDWLLQAKSFTKLMEGGYERSERQPAQREDRTMAAVRGILGGANG